MPRRRSPLPFGIHRVPDRRRDDAICGELRRVSIAFRHSPRSRLADVLATLPPHRRLHCLSAFTAFPTPVVRTPRPCRGRDGLHCLSAFTAFPTNNCRIGGAVTVERLHCLSAFTAFPTAFSGGCAGSRDLEQSPLPFGIHRVPDRRRFGQAARGLRPVSIAFRHSPRSRRSAVNRTRPTRPAASPLPFGIHRVPDCRSGLGTRSPGRSVSIAFRHSPRSRPGPCQGHPPVGPGSPLPFGIHRVPDNTFVTH